jgi:flagellin
MTSILTNVAANSALQTLRTINDSLEQTQNRVSSGYKVSQASDNVAYWSISTTMNSDNDALNAAADALGVGAAKVDTAYAAMESAIDVVNEIKSKLVTANENSTDKEQIQLEITKLQEQLSSIAQGASFSGENWMVAEDTADPETVVDGFIRNDDGTVEVTTASYDVASSALFGSIDADGNGTGGILGADDGVMSISLTSETTSEELADYLSGVETALSSLTDAGAALGALQTRIDLQTAYAGELSNSIEEGVSRLVDADMEEESAKLSALQTQQQLAIQSLSIANSSSQNIMSLFQQ